MKKGLKIAGIALGVIIVLMIAIPFLFKGKIKETVIKLANEQLNAEVAIGDFGLNLFSNFPSATLSLNDVSVSGINDFQGDTLVEAKSLSATINLFSLFNGNYEISKIELDHADVYAKLLSDGRANWDIVKDTTTTEEESAPFELSLDKVVIDHCNITYDDQISDMKVILSQWNGTLSGDMDADETTLKTNSTIDEVSFFMAGIPYLNKAKVAANVSLLADLKNMKFTINESDLQLNEIKAHIDGSVAMVGETGMDFDLKLNAPDTQFKDILSIVPAMYTEDFKNVKTSGTASLEAYIKGLMDDEIYPAFNLKLLVRDAMFQYPSLPKSVNNIHIDLQVDNKGGSLDNTVVNVSKFGLTMGGNPFNAGLNLKTPISDPNIKAHIDGKLDLGMIKDVYPLDKGLELNGKLTANLNVATRLSAIERGQYENVAADGKLTLSGMTYKSPDMPEVVINDAAMEFTPKYVNLTSMNVKIGQNDLSATGRLENFIAYALKGQTLKGQLNLKSNYFNANDFLSDEETPTEETASTGTFEVPKNIDFALDAAMNKVIYENITLTNLNGSIGVKNGIISMNNVSANALGGSCKVIGSYSTAENTAKPKVDLSLNLNKVSFAETFKSVEAIQKFAPVFEKLTGNYSMNLKFNTTLGDNIMQILSGLTGDGLLQTDDVKVEGIEALSQLSSALKLNSNSLQSFSTKNLNIPFKVENGKITTKPFNINIGSEGKLNFEGSTGLDQSINYKGIITLPKSMSNSFINNVAITIGGTFTKPKIGIDTKSLLSNVAGSALDKALGGGEGKDLNTAISDEKAKQAQNLRDKAQSAADKLVSEAQAQGQKLVDASKNPIAKIAAKAAADKLVDEAKKQGQKLINEADVQAKKLEGE
jgi:hypothetical protein